MPTPARAYRAMENGFGSVTLVADGVLRIENVSDRVWRFAVSGYPLLYKWLKARSGEATHGAEGSAMLRDALDVAWRIEELVSLADRADVVLADALELTLTRDQLNLPEPDPAAPEDDADDVATA